jgi:hypothetical protein
MSLVASIAAFIYHSHILLAVVLWAICGLLAFLAIAVGFIENIPKPHVVVIGYGKVLPGQSDGLLIENDGEPAHNILPPDPVPLGTAARVIFGDPAITRDTKEDGKRCFPVFVETSLGKSSAANSLSSQMIVKNIPEIAVKFRYSDGKKPTCHRYTTIGKVERNVAVPGGISGVFVKQKVDWLRWRD